MPLKTGRMTPMERSFVGHMARTGDTVYSATKAGYSQPSTAGAKLMSNPAIADATRDEAKRILREQGAALGVYTLMEIAADEKQPGGTRVQAAKELVKASGISAEDEAGGKDLHEMSGAELNAYAAKLERQRDAILRALADQARPVIEQESIPNDSAFG